MPRHRRRPSIVRFFLLLLLAGVAAGYYFSLQTPAVYPPVATTASSTSVPALADTRRLALVTADGVTVLGLDGKTERLTTEQFKTRFPDAQTQNGVNAANGAAVDGRSPDGQYEARLSASQADGAAVISLTKNGDASRKLVLRSANKPLADAFLYGWFDDRTMIVAARSTSTRAVYGVDIGGGVHPVAALADNVVSLEGRGGLPAGQAGAAWLITATLGEGIESSPTAPSELHRISADGTDTLVARDLSHVFVSAVPGPDGRIAVVTDDSQASIRRIGDETSTKSLGKVRPLFFTPEGELVARDGFSLVLIDPSTDRRRTLGNLPAGSVTVFFLDQMSKKP